MSDAIPNDVTSQAETDAGASSTDFPLMAGRVWWIVVLQGVLGVIFGILALAYPIRTAVLLALIAGIYAIVDGVVDVIVGIRSGPSSSRAWRIALGVLSVVFGILVLAWPGLSLAVLVVSLAIWAAAVGILQIVASVGSRHQRGWGWGVVRGILWLLLGVVVTFAPGMGLAVLIYTFAVWALLAGVVLVVLGIRLRSSAATV